ncbi:Uncharacterised protein [Mycobacteroides abscessus subsp. abscessus]|nr:Uncharacterised protein [Mycobacteroides abscessus subsp. abscessus]
MLSGVNGSWERNSISSVRGAASNRKTAASASMEAVRVCSKPSITARLVAESFSVVSVDNPGVSIRVSWRNDADGIHRSTNWISDDGSGRSTGW